jgi:hypothetical protein
MIIFIGVLSLPLVNCDEKKMAPTQIGGSLVNHSSCKSSKSGLILNDVPDSISCINYMYDKDSKTLSLSHLNAGFNCCPESLYCKISINADTIMIEEFEKNNACDCNCLFDLDYELSGVEKKSYFLKFTEPYALDQEPLLFEIDLSAQIEGSYCVTRTQYPWGMMK